MKLQNETGVREHQITESGNHKQLVTYYHTLPDGTREIRKGLLIGRYANMEGKIFVCIDNFTNRKFIDNLISIKTLSEQW